MPVRSVRVIVEVRDADTGAIIFTGTPTAEGDRVVIARHHDRSARLTCNIPDLSAALEQPGDGFIREVASDA